MNFRVLSRTEAPVFRARGTAKFRARQAEFEGFVSGITRADVGQLDLLDGEQVRSVKVNLRRASTRLGTKVEIWDVGTPQVYFRLVK